MRSLAFAIRIGDDGFGRRTEYQQRLGDLAMHHHVQTAARVTRLKQVCLLPLALIGFGVVPGFGEEELSTPGRLPVVAESGGLSGLRRLSDMPLRDTSVCRGPCGERYEALPHAGHNVFFQDEVGGWWSTYFGSSPSAPWQERPGVLPIHFDNSGRIRPGAAPPRCRSGPR